MNIISKINDGVVDIGRIFIKDYYSDGYPWVAGYSTQLSGCSVAQDGKDILKAGELYTAEGMRLRDAIRHAEISGDPVPESAYERLWSLQTKNRNVSGIPVHPADALLDPEYRKQIQGLKDMTAALNGEQSSPVVFSTDPESVLNKKMKIFDFGTAPQAMKAGYKLVGTLHSTEEELRSKHQYEDLIFVHGASVFGRPDVHEFARYERINPALKIYEITAAGFNASSDATDDLVYWVASASSEAVNEAIKDTGAAYCGEVHGYSLSDVDFHLPRQSMQLSSTLLEKASELRNLNRPVG